MGLIWWRRGTEGQRNPRSKGPGRVRRARAKDRRRGWQVEGLEDRVVPAATWTQLANLYPGPPGQFGRVVGTPMLLSDGTVMVQGGDSSNQWFRLTPDAQGNFVNGTWSPLASMNDERLYFGSNVLPDGRVFVLGGEYNGPAASNNWINTGEIYDPIADTWTSIPDFPQSQFGDDPTLVLPSGKILCGYLAGPQTYLFDPSTNTWTQAGTRLRNEQSDEEGYTMLPDGSVLSYDVFNSIATGSGTAQRYIPSTDTWVDAGTVPVALSSNDLGAELGPAFLLPNGTVFQLGATSNTAIYDPSTNSWVAGPTIPNGDGCDDAPGVMLPNGHVLFAADNGPTSGTFSAPTHIYDYDPVANTITQVTLPAPLKASLDNNPAFIDRFVELPNGHVLFCDGSSQIWDYNPSGSPNASWLPTISTITPKGNNTFTLTGTQLTGLSQGAGYGDDVEMDSNFPIVSLTDQSGNVYFCRTTNWTPGVATGATPVSVDFTLPANLPPGPFNLTVSASGIISNPIKFSLAPFISNISQTSAVEGSGKFQLTIKGSFSDPSDFVQFGSTKLQPSAVNASQISVSVPANLLVEDGTFPLTVFDPNGAPGFQTSNIVNFTVTEAAITPGVGTNLGTIKVGQSVSGTLGGFSDVNPSEPASDYSVMVNWGDGSPFTPATLTATSTPGQYTYAASHQYNLAGSFTILAIIQDDGTGRTFTKSTVQVNPSVPTLTGTSQVLTVTEGGTTGSVVVATFTDSDPTQPASSYSASINWGDGTAATVGTITALGGGQFSVNGTHTYAEDGTDTVTVSIQRGTIASTTVTSSANVLDASITAGLSLTVAATEGKALNNVTVATFTDGNPLATAGGYTASIDWGDNTGTTTGQVKSLGNGNWAVLGSHTYNDESVVALPIKVTLADGNNPPVTLNASASVADAALTASIPSGLSTQLNTPFTKTVATFTDGNPLATAGEFSVQISWGDGTVSPPAAVTFLKVNSAGQPVFQVTGSYTYTTKPASGNSYPLQITITDVGGSKVTVKGSIGLGTSGTGGGGTGGGTGGGGGPTGGVVAVGADAGSLPEVQILNSNGGITGTIQAYESTYRGGVRVASGTLNGVPVVVTVPGANHAPTVEIFNERTGQLLDRFTAFGGGNPGGLYVAFGDVNGDGTADVAVSQGPHGTGLVEVFNGATLVSGSPSLLSAPFFGLGRSFAGGTTVAIGGGELVVGAGPGAAPIVDVYRFNGSSFGLVKSFNAFGTTIPGGITVAVGDYNGDGTADIVVGAGAGALPEVAVFDGSRLGSSTTPPPLLAGFLAYSSTYRGGVRVAAIPVPGTQRADVWLAPGAGTATHEVIEAAFQGGTSPFLIDRAALSAVFAGGAFLG